MTSLISLICSSRPPIISYVLSGTFSTIMRETRGSTLLGRILWMVYESERRATRRDGLREVISSSLSKSTTTGERQIIRPDRRLRDTLTIFAFWLDFDKDLVFA